MLHNVSNLESFHISDNRTREIALSVDDYVFINYPNPASFFSTHGKRPYRLLYTNPTVSTYFNAIYTPAVRAPKQRLGCLYDQALNRIEDSCTWRHRTDELINTDPPHISLRLDPLPVYDRPVLYMGLLRPHFGNFLEESLSKWWALTEELGDIDRYLFHVYEPSVLELPHVKACLSAMHINQDNLIYFDKPVRLNNVIVPQSALQLKSHIYSKYRNILNKIAIALGADESQQTDQPVYLSRTLHKSGVRQYIGEEKIESFLSDRGVRVVHTQLLPLREQFKLVNEHKHIIGFQGSQLLNLAGSLEPRMVINFTEHHPYPDYLLLDKCFENKTTYVKACEGAHIVHQFYINALRRLTGKEQKHEGFARASIINIEWTIGWLKSTGLV